MAEYKLSQNTDEFQELLEIFWETYRFNSREFFTYTCIHTLRLQERGFLNETVFHPGLKFSTSHIICVLSVLLFSFWIDWLRTKEPQFRRPFLKSCKCGDIHTYIHTYIHTHIHTYMNWVFYEIRSTQNTIIYIHAYLQPKISNEHGFGHRQPRLVTYATNYRTLAYPFWNFCDDLTSCCFKCLRVAIKSWQNDVKMTSNAGYWTVDRENLGTRLSCFGS